MSGLKEKEEKRENKVKMQLLSTIGGNSANKGIKCDKELAMLCLDC